MASKHQLHLMQKLHSRGKAENNTGLGRPLPTSPGAGRQLCSSSRFLTSRQPHHAALVCQNNNQLRINWQLYQKAAEETRGPRQLSKQEITQDFKYGISTKESSDTGLSQDVNNMHIHRNSKAIIHSISSGRVGWNYHIADDIFLRWQNHTTSLLLMLGLAIPINNGTSDSQLVLNQCRWTRQKPKAKSHKLFHTSAAIHRYKFSTQIQCPTTAEVLFFLKLSLPSAQRTKHPLPE